MKENLLQQFVESLRLWSDRDRGTGCERGWGIGRESWMVVWLGGGDEGFMVS